jgi:hypothetical protein
VGWTIGAGALCLAVVAAWLHFSRAAAPLPAPPPPAAVAPKPRGPRGPREIIAGRLKLELTNIEMRNDKNWNRIEMEIMVTLPEGKALKSLFVIGPSGRLDTGEALRGTPLQGVDRIQGPGPGTPMRPLPVRIALFYPDPNPNADRLASVTGRVYAWLADKTETEELLVPSTTSLVPSNGARGIVKQMVATYNSDRVTLKWTLDRSALTTLQWHQEAVVDTQGTPLRRVGPGRGGSSSLTPHLGDFEGSYALDGRAPAKFIVYCVTEVSDHGGTFEFRDIGLPVEAETEEPKQQNF